MEMLAMLLWVILTFFLVSLSAIIAKKYGVVYIIGLFGAMVVIANILANKIVTFFLWTAPAGVIVYSTTFLLTDMLSEFYGKKTAKQAIWVGFFANLVLVVSVLIAITWPSADFWTNQEAFESILGNTWRIVLASFIAYIVSQNHDVWAFHFWKKKTNGKYLWLRNNFSTIVSQFIDTVVFVFIAFYGLFPIGHMIVGLFIIKVILALVDTPFIYLVRYFYNK